VGEGISVGLATPWHKWVGPMRTQNFFGTSYTHTHTHTHMVWETATKFCT